MNNLSARQQIWAVLMLGYYFILKEKINPNYILSLQASLQWCFIQLFGILPLVDMQRQWQEAESSDHSIVQGIDLAWKTKILLFQTLL